MSYIVIDLEFNQAYDFDDNNPTILNPKCRFEVIQIGAVKLNGNFEIIDKANYFIKPKLYKRIHPYVQKITGLTMKDLENKKTFPEVFKDFSDFAYTEGEDKILCVWGKSDIKALYRNLSFYGIVSSPLIIKYIDVQKLATAYLKYSKGGTIGLKNAAEALGLATEEPFHDAYYDALYTAKILNIVKTDPLQIKIFNSAHIIDKNNNSESK